MTYAITKPAYPKCRPSSQNASGKLAKKTNVIANDSEAIMCADSFDVEFSKYLESPTTFGRISASSVKMTSFDSGLKYHGYSLEGEYFLRWLDHFKGPGTAGLPTIFSHGFQMQAATMVLPKTLQIYLGGSTIYGKYGNPYDFRAGVNLFPFHNKVVRWNNEFLYLRRSPVGYPSVPFALGGNGPVFHSNLELAF